MGNLGLSRWAGAVFGGVVLWDLCPTLMTIKWDIQRSLGRNTRINPKLTKLHTRNCSTNPSSRCSICEASLGETESVFV